MLHHRTRAAVAWLGLCVWMTGCAAPNHAARGVGCVGISVSNADTLSRFYRDVLTFTDEPDAPPSSTTSWPADRTKRSRLRLGNECVDLVEHLGRKGRPFPADARSNDLTFQHVAIVVRDMDRAYDVLRAHGVEAASLGPQTLPAWNERAGGIRAFYFRDPDRHYLELIWFPPDKRAAAWSRPGEDLFLGIDHTAIVVSDTSASLRFYRDGLGLRVTGGSENWGIEQERLNAVPGAHLRITTLRAPSGPGIELLEYLAPQTGRRAPPDLSQSDLVHWTTEVLFPTTDPALVRDPDGHAMLLIDR